MMNSSNEPSAFTRRAFLAAGLAALGGDALAASTGTPIAVITALYRRTLSDHEPNWSEKAERARDLSKSLVALWAKTDPKLVEDDEGPVDFSVIADTNGLTLTGFSLKPEKQDDKTATIAATLVYKEGNPRREPSIVRYDLVREDGEWKIDEIRGKNWSLRNMLTRFLKD